jgi:hypothetical protein
MNAVDLERKRKLYQETKKREKNLGKEREFMSREDLREKSKNSLIDDN